MLENLVSNPENITFPILFVGLLIWVMKTNDTREQNYRDTISDLRQALLNNKETKEKIDAIYTRVSNNG